MIDQSNPLISSPFAIPATGLVAQLAVGLILLGIYGALTWFTFLKPDDRQLITSIAKSPARVGELMRGSAG